MFYFFDIKQVLLTQFYWVCRVFSLKDAEASVEPLGLRIESGSVLLGFDCFTVILVRLIRWYDVDMF